MTIFSGIRTFLCCLIWIKLVGGFANVVRKITRAGLKVYIVQCKGLLFTQCQRRIAYLLWCGHAYIQHVSSKFRSTNNTCVLGYRRDPIGVSIWAICGITSLVSQNQKTRMSLTSWNFVINSMCLKICFCDLAPALNVPCENTSRVTIKPLVEKGSIFILWPLCL